MWQEALKMTFTGQNMRNYRICNKHFADGAYLSVPMRRLRTDARPLPFIRIDFQDPTAKQSKETAETALTGNLLIKNNMFAVVGLL